jgi:hypothetical protein
MRDTPLKVMDGQSRTNPNSTGTISSNVLDLEQDSDSNVLLTDDQVEGWLNYIITDYSYTSGGTEGMIFEVRNGDNSDLATGVEVIGSVQVPLADLAIGKKIPVPFKRDVAERYLGGWIRAASTTLTGTIECDADFSNLPISENESLQKVVS